MEQKRSINTQMKIEPTNQTALLTNYVLKLFHTKYTSGAIRNVAVNYSGLVDESFGLISLFDDIEKIEKKKGSSPQSMLFEQNLGSLHY